MRHLVLDELHSALSILDAAAAPVATDTPLTAEQVKQRLRAAGTTITEWADRNGYKRNAVYRVLNGFDKAHYGKAHEIAVKLGIKPQPESSSIAA